MPGFNLPEAAVDELVAFIISLNAVAAESTVEGDRTAGREFFFGKGRCSSCHMVNGEGSPIGPDLSSIARELTLDQLRESLQNPDARIAPGYGLVSVGSFRGFARNRTSFELALQDLSGKFHFVALDRAAITEDKHSLMQPVSGSRSEQQNVLAFLSKLTGIQPGTNQTVQNSRRHITTQTRRLADIQRKPQRESLQRPHSDQQVQREQARA